MRMVMIIMVVVMAEMVFVVISFLVSNLAMLVVPLVMVMEVGPAVPVAPGPLLMLHGSEVLLHPLLLPQTQVLLHCFCVVVPGCRDNLFPAVRSATIPLPVLFP